MIHIQFRRGDGSLVVSRFLSWVEGMPQVPPASQAKGSIQTQVVSFMDTQRRFFVSRSSTVQTSGMPLTSLDYILSSSA